MIYYCVSPWLFLGYMLLQSIFWRTNQGSFEKEKLQGSHLLGGGAWVWRWNVQWNAILCSCPSGFPLAFWLAFWGGSESLSPVRDNAAIWSVSFYNARSKSLVTAGISYSNLISGVYHYRAIQWFRLFLVKTVVLFYVNVKTLACYTLQSEQ